MKQFDTYEDFRDWAIRSNKDLDTLMRSVPEQWLMQLIQDALEGRLKQDTEH